MKCIKWSCSWFFAVFPPSDATTHPSIMIPRKPNKAWHRIIFAALTNVQFFIPFLRSPCGIVKATTMERLFSVSIQNKCRCFVMWLATMAAKGEAMLHLTCRTAKITLETPWWLPESLILSSRVVTSGCLPSFLRISAAINHRRFKANIERARNHLSNVITEPSASHLHSSMG